MEIELIIKSFLIGFFLSSFEPLQNLFDKYVKSKIKNSYIRKAFSCHMCISFWTGIIYFQDFYVGSAAALLAYLMSRILAALPAYYNLNNNN